MAAFAPKVVDWSLIRHFRFVTSAVFAGILNTGAIRKSQLSEALNGQLLGAALEVRGPLTDLDIRSECREKCKKEIQPFLSRHFNDTLSSAHRARSSTPSHYRHVKMNSLSSMYVPGRPIEFPLL